MSNLGRLYAYAKGGVDAKEDFMTEALAICLRHDPAPFIDAHRAEGLLADDVSATAVEPYTQLSVPGVGRVDLVVRLGGATLEECWFEVKVDAPETGDQLARYAAHISALPPDGRPQLMTLARDPIRSDGPPLLPWRTVHAAARSSATPHWQDLADWLEELRMVDAHDGPISLDELEAFPKPSASTRSCATYWPTPARAWHLATRSSHGREAARSAAWSRGSSASAVASC